MFFLAALLALTPGIYAWWTGRALLKRLDDPAFPELLLARGQRRIHVAVAVAVVSPVIPGGYGFWSLLLIAFAAFVGGFPFRRALYGESWSLAAYVGHSVLSFVGAAGFWFALAFSPFLVFALVEGWTPGSSPVQGALIVGAIVAIALVIWELAHPQFFLSLHRASPLQRSDLKPRFDDIVARSAVANQPPQVFRYGFRGAYMMNAFALPSLRQPRVAFGDSLLELLTADEIVAVFAHEVSHLEHYNRRRMARIRFITYLLILGGTALPAAIYATAPALTWIVKLAWPVIVLTLLALRVSKSQAHETESDLRAGALTGDPEAMVRALTKLHHYSRMPRRWPYDFERAASHPSLARRIQALRTQGTAAATSEKPKLAAPIVLRSTEPGAYAVLDDGRAYWFDGVPTTATAPSLNELRELAASYRAVAYADLSELRVAVVRGGGRALLTRDSSGRTWSMPIREEDVAAAQQALDVLDVRLGNHPREDWPMNARAAATLLALTLVGAGDFGWTWLPILLTLVRPSAGALAAMGSMVIGRVLFSALAGTLGASALGTSWAAVWLIVTAMLGVGAWSCRIAWRWTRGDHKPIQRSFALVALATILVLLVGALAMSRYAGTPAIRSPFVASTELGTALALVLLGVGVGLATYRDNLRRRSGAAVAVLALVLAGVNVGGSGLLTARSAITWTSAKADVAGRMAVSGGGAYRLHLSPTGQYFAVQRPGPRPARYADSGDDEAVSLWRFTLGTVGGGQRATEAFDLAFVDDAHILVLRPTPTSGDSLDLSVERVAVGDSTATWRRTIPAYFAPTLMLDRVTGTWRVNGYDTEGSAFVTSVGRIGSDSVSTTRLTQGLVGGRPLHTYRDGTSLIATLHGTFGWGRMMLSMFGFYPYRWDIWHVANGVRRSVGDVPGLPECGAASNQDDTAVCVVQGRSGMTLWSISRDSTGATPLGTLATDADRWDIGANGRVAAISRDGDMLALVDATTRRGTRISLGGVQLQGTTAPSLTFTTDVAVASDIVATLVVREGKSEVILYRLK